MTPAFKSEAVPRTVHCCTGAMTANQKKRNRNLFFPGRCHHHFVERQPNEATAQKQAIVMAALLVTIAIGGVFATSAFVVPHTTKHPLTHRWSSSSRSSKTITFMSSEYAESQAIVDDDFDDDENQQVRLISFEDLGLSREALNAIRAQPDWKIPTPIQQLAIPRLLVSSSSNPQDGDEDEMFDSVWCEAPTGSGKTAAYALPLLDNLLQKRRRRRRSVAPRRQPRRGKGDNDDEDSGIDFSGDVVKALVLCPTRELAIQIGSVLTRLASNMSPRRKIGDRENSNDKSKVWNIQVIHGGVRLEPQISALATCINDGTEIDVLVATPGRLADILTFYSSDKRSRDDKDEDAVSDLSPTDAALERRLLDALDATGRKDVSLSLSQIEALQLDRTDDDGRELLRNVLSNVEYLVLDEADRLLGKAFESEMNALLGLVSGKEQVKTWLFSATFPKHSEPRIDHVLKMMGGPSWKPPLRISCSQSDRLLQEEISSQLQKRLDRLAAKTNSSVTSGSTAQLQQIGPASTIQLRTIRLDKRDRTQALRRLLETEEGWDRVLVFVATRYSSEHVATKLRRVGIESAELHGKLDQEARLRRLSDFTKGKIRVLLATDVASRGLDVVGLPAVVNYDLPRSTADFTHRVGRTGRAGRQGVAVTFVTPESEPHLDLIERRHLPKPVEREILAGFEPDEEEWQVRSEAARMETPGVEHSSMGLAHDRMFGGIKGRRKSKKDRMREQTVRDQKQPSP